MNNFYSFSLTFISGIVTLVGFLLVLYKFKNIDSIIIFSLSFSSGVMLSISFFDLFKESIKLFQKNNSVVDSYLIFIIFFIIGMVVIICLNKIIKNNNSLYKVGIISMMAIIIHNVPEGIITFISSNVNQKLGLELAFAIAMHNIPEGISIAVPIYYSTKSYKKTFFYTLISALSEPFGALIAYIFLQKFITGNFIAILFSLVAGIMTYIPIYELLPESNKYNNKSLLVKSLIFGILFMFISLKLL